MQFLYVAGVIFIGPILLLCQTVHLRIINKSVLLTNNTASIADNGAENNNHNFCPAEVGHDCQNINRIGMCHMTNKSIQHLLVPRKNKRRSNEVLTSAV